MGDDDCGGPVRNGIGKDLPGMDLGPVDQADGNHPGRDDLIGPIQRDAEEMLLFPVGIVLN